MTVDHPLRNRKSNVLANTRDAQADSIAVGTQINGKSVGAMLNVIYKYSRVYVLKGTVLSIISISLLAVQRLSDITPSFFLGVLQAVIGGCLANLYVVGLNQLSDIEIDKVNKPYLPLASGELSVKAGIRITSLYAILGFCLGWSIRSWHLKLCIFLWYAVGTAYSVHLPLLRWKEYPMLVALCSWLFQGVTLPMLFHLHALDIPDVEGDKRNGFYSFATKFGPQRVFWICIWLLELIYGIAIFIGLSSTHLWIRPTMVTYIYILIIRGPPSLEYILDLDGYIFILYLSLIFVKELVLAQDHAYYKL
ncbi:putative homogentisate phytyltransferase [Helianthus annuus]|nr:putative homogentisate phytyltransferase [Helianthus annuus]